MQAAPLAAEATVEAAPGPAGEQLNAILVESTPLGGGTVNIDKIPGNVQVLSTEDLTREGAASLTGAMSSRLGSISINDNLDDPYQPDIVYRGFEASPVLGTPQGLAVYQSGVRINEAFGDTVNWDLFPDLAVERVEIVSSSPVYGRNALGGAISVTMKNAFEHSGGDLELSGGSYEQRAAAAQYGIHSDTLGVYVAGKALDWDGWRRFSSDAIRQLYGVVSVRLDPLSIDLSYDRADNRLNGQGAAPVQELAVNRSLIFTGPQTNIDTLDFATLNASLRLSKDSTLQIVLYDRQYAQTVENGNSTEYTSCVSQPGVLCQPDGLEPVTNAAGEALPDISQGGTVPIGENDYELIHSYTRGLALQLSNGAALAGRDNRFSAGATVDYALTNFFSGAQLGPLNADLQVLPTGLLVDTPENSAAGQRYAAVPVSLRALNKDYGFFVTDTLDLTAALSVTASGRYNLSAIDLEDQRGTDLTGNNRYTHFNPALGLTQELRRGLHAYASLAQNTRTPTASEIECSDPSRPCLLPSSLSGDPPTLRQVVARTVELGLRGSASQVIATDGHLDWNVSVFRTRLHDDIFGIATFVSKGFYQNIGDTRRQGIEAGLNYRDARWTLFANVSYVAAQFESPLTVPSPSNPFRDANGDLTVRPGDDIPGVPRSRVKLGIDYALRPETLTVGLSLNAVGSFHYVGDASNQLAPIPGYHVLDLHASYRAYRHLELFASMKNVLNEKYATFGILSDPTGVNAPGVPRGATTNGPGVDNRFLSPAAPFEAFGGIRVSF
jgi:iron complex outermembrane receptor protein